MKQALREPVDENLARMPRTFAKLTAACLAALLPTAAHAQRPSLGPLGAEEGAPLQRLGYTPMVEAAPTVAAGAFRADVWLGYANIFEQDSAATHELYLDMERLITAVTVRYGLTDGLEVGGRATLETVWGGILDGFVETLHNSLRLGNRNRPMYPSGAYGSFLRDGEGRTLIDVPKRSLALDDVRLFAKWRMVRSPAGMASLRAVMRVPTQDPATDPQRTDFALMTLGTAPWRGVHFHGMAGGSTVRRAPEMEDVLRDRQWFAMVGVERPFREGLSGVIEFTGSTQLLRDFNDHDVDGAPTNVVFGVVGVTDGGWRWEAAMQEDLPPRGPSIDFTLQLALSRTW